MTLQVETRENVFFTWNQICSDVAFEIHCSPDVVCRNTGKWRSVPAKQKNTSNNTKTKSQIHKRKTKQSKPSQANTT